MFRMDLSQIPLFAMLRGRLGYLSDRQQVIAQNVANSDTPGFTPKDLTPFSFTAKLDKAGGTDGATPAVTQPGHMALPGAEHGAASETPFKAVSSRDSEMRLDGNSVVLEEEMMKLSDARMNYDAAISFYQKSLSLLRTAARAPGK
jgi:flagellar basal-body rod protein FlgB